MAVAARHAAIKIGFAVLMMSTPLQAADWVESKLSPPLLPAELSQPAQSWWEVGPALARGSSTANENRFFDNQLFGLSLMWRTPLFGINERTLISPNLDEFEDIRFLQSLGGLGFLELGGIEWSYGVSVDFEARLRDHYWFMSVTPVEIAAQVWDRGSWAVRLHAGARMALHGDLIDHFLIDPNGVDNKSAQDELDDRLDHPFEAFVSLVFARRID